MDFSVYTIPVRGAEGPVRLAGKELIHWLSVGHRRGRFLRTTSMRGADFILGTFEDLGEALGEKLRNDRWIDEIVVRSIDGRVFLAGSNPRSVLFAVYTYLDDLGFAWIVPGKDGEIVPRLKDIPLGGYDIHHRASLIYRGFALAGAFDAKMGEEFVEWMGRNRFNHLFLEGETRRGAYQQALRRRISTSEASRYDQRIVRATKRRGLIFEKAGHGWTARALGFPPGSGQVQKVRRHPEVTLDAAGNPIVESPPRWCLSDAKRPMASELNGVREIHRSPNNTHLCLSNPKSLQEMTKEVSRYAKSHPEMDVLAIWMADGFNNWCECSKCAKVHPSDLWVRLINRIAREVYRVRPGLKIEVLGYSVLMEPPPNERIDNSRGNVILMTAPFLRCYLHTLDDPNCISEKPLHTFPPANKLHHPMNGEYFRFYKEWISGFRGTNYIFDYYCWLPIKRDFFEGNVPKAMHLDMKSYPSHGIDGMVDCSRAQSFWPTPLTRWLQARASWNASVNYSKERRRLLELTFGKHAEVVDKYLKLAYGCLLPDPHGREEERGFSAAKVRRFKQSLPALHRTIDKAISSSSGAAKKFLRRVALHADYTVLHLDALLSEQSGDYDEAMALVAAMHAMARSNARTLKGAVDPPEIDWMRRDAFKRLQAKKDGSWKRID